MAYIGQGIDRFSNVEKLDAITPATATGAGPYNLTKGGVAFTPSSADTMVISINGVVQYGNFTVSSSTVTFSAALADADTCDFIYHMGTGLLSTPVDNSVSTAKIVDSNITTAKINNSADPWGDTFACLWFLCDMMLIVPPIIELTPDDPRALWKAAPLAVKICIAGTILIFITIFVSCD